MHTTIGPSGTTFLHNGDFSGDVTILATGGAHGPRAIVEPAEMVVPFEDLEAIVAAKVAGDRIARLENATTIAEAMS